MAIIIRNTDFKIFLYFRCHVQYIDVVYTKFQIDKVLMIQVMLDWFWFLKPGHTRDPFPLIDPSLFLNFYNSISILLPD